MKNLEWQKYRAMDAGYMFVPRCLLQTPSLPKSAAIVYAAIVDDDMDGDGVITVKKSRLARKTGYSERQVSSALNILIDADLLEPEPDRTGRANIYRLTERIIPPKRSQSTSFSRSGQ